MRRWRRGRKRRKNNKIVEEGIITLRSENNEIEGKYQNCGGGAFYS